VALTGSTVDIPDQTFLIVAIGVSPFSPLSPYPHTQSKSHHQTPSKTFADHNLSIDFSNESISLVQHLKQLSSSGGSGWVWRRFHDICSLELSGDRPKKCLKLSAPVDGHSRVVTLMNAFDICSRGFPSDCRQDRGSRFSHSSRNTISPMEIG
jgi:hypothetical protein